MFGRVVCDFGEGFQIVDKDGEHINELNIESITQQGLVTIFKNQQHTLQEGDTVTFQEVVEDTSSG